MKSIITLISLFLISCFLQMEAQNLASTDPQPRNVVLEELTGIYCGFCPDGHRLAQELYNNNPGRVVLVNVHAGSYSVPQAGSGHPDFRTPYGDALVTLSNLAGFPAGMINRQLFEGSQYSQQKAGALALSRGGWAIAAAEVFADTYSPVNIGAKIERTSLTTLEITVELYYTATTGQNSKLNIALLEDGFVGYQAGSGGDEEYVHNHILRDFITGQWGEVITGTNAGQTFTKKYTYTITDRVKPIGSNLKMAFYVTQADNKHIYTGIQMDVPSIKPNAELTSKGEALIPVTKNKTFTKTATLKNISDAPVTFNVSTNSDEKQGLAWTAELANPEQSTITLQPQESANINYVVKTNANLGKMSATLKVEETNTDLMLSYSDEVTAISSDAEYYLITDKSEEQYSVENYMIKGGYDKFINIYPTDFKVVKDELSEIKTLVWNGGAAKSLTNEETETITTLMSNDVKVLLMGNQIIGSLYNSDALGYFGISYLGYSTQGYGSSPWRVWLSGVSDDPITWNMGLMFEGNLIQYLLCLVKVVDFTTTSAILHFSNDGKRCVWNSQTSKVDTFDIAGVDAIFGVKVQKPDSRHVILGFTPYVIKNVSLRERLIKSALDWMHGVVGVDENETDFSNALAAYPNPANNSTNLRFSVNGTKNAEVRVFITDYLGKQIADFSYGSLAPGDYNKFLDLQSLSSGCYNIILTVNGVAQTTKLAIIN